MTENWRPYLCKVNEQLASIFVNLGLREAAPVASKPWLLWKWVYLQSPRSDGLSDSAKAPTLFKIEDVLDSSLARNCRAIPCGRITTAGRREFYFYGETREGLGDAVATALASFHGYKFDLGEHEDSLWEHYLDVLYPSPEDLERIKNRDLLEVLAEKGDVLTTAREVRHWMYFRSEQSRTSFREAASKAGFKIVSELPAKGEHPFGISVSRTQSVDHELIDATVIELLGLTQRFEGDYDGWETPIVTQ
jgi:uncharacterized protein (TIGR01619 family)